MARNRLTIKKEIVITLLIGLFSLNFSPYLTYAASDNQEPLIDNNLKEVIQEKRAEDLMDNALVEKRIEDIIKQKKEEEKRSKYMTFGPGDIVQISVRNHPELSGQTAVRLDGELILPLTNDLVIAKDLTLEELTQRVTEKMATYIKEPQINISVVQYRSKVFFAVDDFGATPYPITRGNFTLRDAIFIADWSTDRALGRVLVITPSKTHPIVKEVNAFDIIYKGDLRNNIQIKNGDVIYIPQTYVAKTNRVLLDVLAPISSIAQGAAAPLVAANIARRYKGLSMSPIKESNTIFGFSNYGSGYNNNYGYRGGGYGEDYYYYNPE